jgi:NitT/TauT family transport system permease protein
MGDDVVDTLDPRRGARRGRGVGQAPAGRPVLVGLLSVLGGLVAWEGLSRVLFTPVVLPAPTLTASAAWDLWDSGELPRHAASSYSRILAGFLLGSLGGVLIGVLMGTSEHARRMLEPLVNFFRFVPPIAWLGIVLIWFGVGEASKVLIVVYATSFVVLLSAMAGVSAVPLHQRQAARCLGANWWQVLRWVELPGAIPHIVTGMRIALGNAFATIVTAEMLAAESGVGYLILVSRNYMATDVIFVGIAVLGLLGLGTSWAFAVTARRLARRFLVAR